MPDMSHPINNVITGSLSLSALHDLTFEGWWPEDQDEKMMKRKGIFFKKKNYVICVGLGACVWKPEVEPPGAGVTSSFEPSAVSSGWGAEPHPGPPAE